MCAGPWRGLRKWSAADDGSVNVVESKQQAPFEIKDKQPELPVGGWNLVRAVCYICMTPKDLATPEVG